MRCIRCSYELAEGELICPRCGFVAVEDTRSTAVLHISNRRKPREENEEQDAPLTEKVVLLIRGLRKQLLLNEINNLIVGRADPARGGIPDIDLTAFGAEQRGVSRQHLKMHYAEGQLTITDLGSANGTRLNGEKLQANQGYPVKDGDEILLGQLAVRVNFL